MEFNIRFFEIAESISRGEMVLGQFAERFESPLDFWTAADYEQQWKDGVSRLIEGKVKSALVTAMYSPEVANFIMWWVMYRDSDAVVFRSHVLLVDQLQQPFDISRLYSFVPERIDSPVEEYPVSEWIVEFDSIRAFISA